MCGVARLRRLHSSAKAYKLDMKDFTAYKRVFGVLPCFPVYPSTEDFRAETTLTSNLSPGQRLVEYNIATDRIDPFLWFCQHARGLATLCSLLLSSHRSGTDRSNQSLERRHVRCCRECVW